MHAFIDKYSVAMTALLLKNNRWFKNSLESPHFKEHLDNITITLPKIKGEGFYEVEAASFADTIDPAFHVAKWLGPQYPTVIYHHGNNERPFHYGPASKNTFKSILNTKKDSINANLISLRAPFHNNGFKHYFDKMGSLANFTAMLSVSVKLIEDLVQYLKSQNCSRVIVTGLSLGGWVANLHRCFFNSAHSYIPIFAGAALDDLFLISYYKKLAHNSVKENPNAVRTVLNFEEEFRQIEDENIFPLLARFDQIITFDVQKSCYKAQEIKVIDKGHITGALASKVLREHILANLS